MTIILPRPSLCNFLESTKDFKKHLAHGLKARRASLFLEQLFLERWKGTDCILVGITPGILVPLKDLKAWGGN